MTRILADLPHEHLDWLDKRAAEQGRSRASILREAVATFKAQMDGTDWLDRGFGLWARAGVTFDARDYERRRRAEWTRPWDDDYDEVRAESPDCFTAEDDKERAHYLALTQTAGKRREEPGQ